MLPNLNRLKVAPCGVILTRPLEPDLCPLCQHALFADSNQDTADAGGATDQSSFANMSLFRNEAGEKMPVVVLSCQHAMHLECARRLHAREGNNMECPTCRNPVSAQDRIDIGGAPVEAGANEPVEDGANEPVEDGANEPVEDGASDLADSDEAGGFASDYEPYSEDNSDSAQMMDERFYEPDEPYDERALCIAARDGDIRLVETLIREGANVDSVASLSYENPKTALMHACTHAHYDVVLKLLTSGADVNKTVRSGVSGSYGALHATCKRSDSESRRTNIARTLIAYGASVHAQLWDGSQPLHLAAHSNLVEVADLLLDAGANVNARKENAEETPLMMAVYGHFHDRHYRNNPTEMAELLLMRGAEVNARINATDLFSPGRTALGILLTPRAPIRDGTQELINLLRSWGATE